MLKFGEKQYYITALEVFDNYSHDFFGAIYR